MRSSRKKRIIAIVLCMVLALGGGAPSLLFDSFQADEISSEDTTSAVQSETVTDETAETVPETTAPAETTTSEAAPADTAADQPTVEQQAAEPEAAPYQEEVELKQDLHDADGNVYCTVTAKIPAETFAANTADVTMEVSTVDDQTTADTVKSLMEKTLAADKQLGSYFLYNVTFKVNGQITEATKSIEITFEQSNFQIGDVKKASTIYYNEANSTAGNVEPEIITIAQRDDKIEELQKAGLSLDTMDTDYDLSQITLNEDGTAKKIMVEGRRSTIYGCYLAEDKPVTTTPNTTTDTTKEEKKTTAKPETEIAKPDTTESKEQTKKEETALTYEDDDVTVTVSANEAGIIPEGATLQVIPILPETQSSVTETSTIAVPEEKEATTLSASENKSTETKVVTPKSSATEYEKVKSQLEEKAANEDYDIAGFLAYDISFIDKEGNKVEPNGNVKVVIDYKQEAIPDGVDAEDDLDVTVMHFEENGSGEVKDVVDMVADDTKTATVETTDSAQVKKAEFETDSFSTFTVVWKITAGMTADIPIQYVNTQKEEISGKDGRTEANAQLANQATIDFENDTDYKVNIDDYVFDHAEIRPQGNGSIRVYQARINYYDNEIFYDYELIKNGSKTFIGDYGQQTVYMVYQKISDMNIVITDDVVNSGQLKVAGKLAADSENYEFKWYKSINGGGFEEVTRKRSGDDYNIDENGTWLNIALDEGALDSGKAQTSVKYQVKVLEKGTSEEAAVSGEYNVTYWKQLQNGGFERPAITGPNLQTSNKAYKDGLGVWQTTGLGRTSGLDIEIINNRCSATKADNQNQNNPYKWNSLTNIKKPGNEHVEAAEGEQFVELNCDAEGALYQDVITIKGTPLNYSLSHRARGDYIGISDVTGKLEEWDEMYVVIVPTALAKAGLHGNNDPIDTQKEVNELTELSEAEKKAKGIYVKSYRDNDQAWGTYSEIAAYTPTSYMSRFFFVAGLTEHDDNKNEDNPFTFGNFLDNVSFGQKLPPANKGEFTLQVTKRIEGLTQAQFDVLKEQLKFTITSTTADAPLNGTVLKASEMKWTITTNANGTISAIGSVTYDKQTIKKEGDFYIYKVEESGTDVSGYLLQKELEVLGGTVQDDKVSTSVKEKDGATFAFSNYYTPKEPVNIPEEPNPTSGSLTKTMGTVTEDGKYPITLEVKTRLEDTSTAANVDVILLIDLSGSMNDESRLEQTKAAAKKFVENFVGADGTISTIHRIGIVTFSKTATINKISGQNFSGNVDAIKKVIKDLSADGGTNTEAGLLKANELAAKSSVANKYVIFLTDGVPTRRNGDKGNSEDDGSGSKTSVAEYNEAVDAAKVLEASVNGIYTIGFLNEMTNNELNVARRLLASSNTNHQVQGYEHCYKPTAGTTGDIATQKVKWDTATDYTYSKGYFEITNKTDAGTKLEAIWTELATIINNSTTGSTGDGWSVSDKMANYTDFLALDGSKMNGHTLTLSTDKTTLTTTISGTLITVATYNQSKKELTWNLNAELAHKSSYYNNGTDYTYTLKYYVHFNDSGATEFRKTNDYTYVTKKEDKKKIYPTTMPFFVNIIGEKLIDGTKTALQGAKFSIYRNADKSGTIASNITSDSNGHFAFQVGQSDLTKVNDTTYSMEVYLEETEAPYGYSKDETLHKITINVANVAYTSEGVASGKGTIAYNPTEGDLVSVDNSGLKLSYANREKSEWGIVKVSSSSETQTLAGAEFELYKKVDDSTAFNSSASYRGTSNTNGILNTWIDLSVNPNEPISSKLIPTGSYLMKETKAPSGYAVSAEWWVIDVTSSGVTIKQYSGNAAVNPIASSSLASIVGTSTDGTYFYYKDTPVYELPNSGGIGIYWYMIGGVLLMLAAALILYRNKKYEGVLKK